MFARSLLNVDPSVTPAANPLALCAPHAYLAVARQLRGRLASRYDEATSYALPGRAGIQQGPDNSEIYDDTAMIAMPEFASRIQQGIIPNFSRWASFIVGMMIQDEDEALQIGAALEQVDAYLFEMLNASNFSVEANECMQDLALGTCALRIDEAAGNNPFNSRSIALGSLLFAIGPDGRPDPIYEERKLNRQALAINYPKATLPPASTIDNPAFEHNVIEVWQRDWSQPTTIAYRMSVIMPDLDNLVIQTEKHEGEGCCPYIVARWSKASGEGWGRGPLFQCLPSMRKVNFAERALLDHTDIALGGIWTMEDDGVINVDTVRLEPGTIVPTAPGSKGLQNVAPAGRFDLAQFTMTEARSTIRKALYTEQLGNPNKTPMSATEVSQRMAELARAIGSAFGRLILEFVMPVIMRAVYILKARGLIKLPAVNGKEIKLISTSPLAQAQRFEDIDNLDKFLGMVGARLGMDMLNIIVDGVEVASQLADRFQIPKKALRPKADRDKILASIQQRMAQGPMDAGGAAAPNDNEQAPGEPTGGAPAG